MKIMVHSLLGQISDVLCVQGKLLYTNASSLCYCYATLMHCAVYPEIFAVFADDQSAAKV